MIAALAERVTRLVSWPTEHHPIPLSMLGVPRTCPPCNDRDGEVRWHGSAFCPWCHEMTGVPT